MDIRQANEIIACLPNGRTLFPYHEDRYALMLLERFIGDGKPIADIKASPFGKLLTRPALREIVAGKGDGMLCREDLQAYCPRDLEHYILTLGLWGWKQSRSWCQTSRNGANLVLQLNFSRKHDRMYRKLVDPFDNKRYVLASHPVCRKGRNTLAWARIDLELDRGEALIEEIQNDWLREASHDLDMARVDLADGYWSVQHGAPAAGEVQSIDVVRYVEQVLSVHYRFWADAMLAATLWFLWEEIGIHRVWYHDHDTGARLKKVGYTRPPRSLYTDLPKRFCFQRTSVAPGFLAQDAPKKFKRRFKQGRERFWQLNL